jgi:hypothetical protein
MKHSWLFVLALLTAACSTSSQAQSTPPQADSPRPAATQSDADAPATQPATLAATQPATQPSDAEQWLDRIEQQARQTQTLHAKLRYDLIQGLLGDEQRRFGTLTYDAGPPARFAVHLDRLVADTALHREDRWYIYDGVWLAERLDKEKMFIRRQLAPQGQHADELLDLGEGPFLLPLNLRKDKVLSRFDVTVVEVTEDDPPNTVHLLLIPKPDVQSEQDQVQLWFDRDSLLPLQVRTISDAESENESLVVLSDVELNVPSDAATFDTTAPTEPGWEVEIHPLEE